MTAILCHHCQGTGAYIDRPCPHCHARGAIAEPLVVTTDTSGATQPLVVMTCPDPTAAIVVVATDSISTTGPSGPARRDWIAGMERLDGEMKAPGAKEAGRWRKRSE